MKSAGYGGCVDLSFIRLGKGRGVRSKRLRNADLNLHTGLLLNCLQIAFSAGRDFLENFPIACILVQRRKPDTIFPMQSAAFFFPGLAVKTDNS